MEALEDAAKAKAWLRSEVLPHVTTADGMRAFRERLREARRAERTALLQAEFGRDRDDVPLTPTEPAGAAATSGTNSDG